MGNMPNFLVIGAARAGTTALYNFLVQHPQVFMSENKEPGFFMLEGTQIENPYSTREYAVNDLETYQSLFADVKPEHVAIGEATTGYLSSQYVPVRVKQRIPDVKLIALLRNPIDRAYSEYELLLRAGRETRSFEDVIEKEPLDPLTDLPWNPDELKYVRKGMYYAHLSRFYNLFDESQIAVFLYEDWRKNQAETLRRIYAALGVDEGFQPDLNIEHNVGGVPKNQFVYNLVFGSKRLKQVAKAVVPTKHLKKVRGAFLDRSKDALTPQTAHRLAEIYRDDVEALQKLINRDLSHWLQVKATA